MSAALALLCWLIIGHCLCDYPLQGDFLARAKNHVAPLPGVPWYQALTAHAAIHAGWVWLFTAHWELALGEFVMHWLIDHRKCAGGLDYDQDQALHILCKVGWVFVLAMWGTWGPGSA